MEGTVDGKKKGDFPVFRVKVTAHCFAEWLGGKLPTRMQWLHAAGKDQDKRVGPYGDHKGTEDLAVDLSDGPRPVTWGKNHVSIYGCRQMAGNGYEWTCDIKGALGNESIPLQQMSVKRFVVFVGQSYLDDQPLKFADMNADRAESCEESRYDIGFRVVLELEAQ